MDKRNNGILTKKKLDKLFYSDEFIQKCKKYGEILHKSFPNKNKEVVYLGRLGLSKDPVDVLVYLKNRTSESYYNHMWRFNDIGSIIIEEIEALREVSENIANELESETLVIYRKIVSEFTRQIVIWYTNTKIKRKEGWKIMI